MHALHDRFLIVPDPEEKRLIWFPEDPYKKYRTGRIVSMGKGMKVNGKGVVLYGRRFFKWKGALDEDGFNRWTMPRVNVGDRVVYLTWSLHVIFINKVEHHLVRDTSLEAILKEEP
jgi:co-chaperonin GroES (HSP10)